MITLPMPPDAMLGDWEMPLFQRAPEMEDFLRTHWIDGATFPNASFAHLQDASVGVGWTNVHAPTPGAADGRRTVGLAEIFQPRPAKRWIMERQRWAMHQIFGLEIPDFVIWFDAGHWAADTVSIATKLGVATHELLHCGQALDEYGAPKYARSGQRKGQPVWSLVPHDVEQFNLVVEWFGAEAAGVIPMARALAAGATMRQLLREAFGAEIGEPEPFLCGTCARAA